MTGAKLTSEDYRAIANRLALILSDRLVETARSCNLKPPFEVDVTGADDVPVMHWSVSADGKCTLLCSDREIEEIDARWPVTATITDNHGESLEISISPDDSTQ